jgi:hypothetical protein
MPIRTCKLCQETRELQRSHLVPSAMFRYASDARSPRPNTVVVSRRGRSAVVRHVTAHLLCSDCEQRFNNLGETWMMQQVWNGERFPLLDRLNVAMEIRPFAGAVAYSGADCGIDTEKLGYFALSVLWRAAVRTWTTSKYSTERIELKAFEEPIRLYLLGDGQFPANVAVVATVCTDRYSRVFYLPAPASFPIPIPLQAFAFLALGVQFLIFTGPFAPTVACCVQSPQRLIFKRDCRQKTLEMFAELIKQ